MDPGEQKDPYTIIAALQATQIVQATVLQALIGSHPDPAALHKYWHKLVPARATAAVQAKASREDGNLTNHFLLQGYQDWQGYLEKHAPLP